MRSLIAGGLAALAALTGSGRAAAQPPAAEPVTVFVVRHAEKGPENPDPSLAAEGRARAVALADALRDAGITAIFVSEFKRTQETAEPLARRLGLTPTRLDAAKMDELASRLRALPAGSRALVVSHSNLIGAIVDRLSGIKIGALTDADYDRLYVVTVRPFGPGGVVYLHFGRRVAAPLRRSRRPRATGRRPAPPGPAAPWSGEAAATCRPGGCSIR